MSDDLTEKRIAHEQHWCEECGEVHGDLHVEQQIEALERFAAEHGIDLSEDGSPHKALSTIGERGLGGAP